MIEAVDTIGARIRKRRETLGLSRERLAEKAGVSAQTILRLEQESDGTTLGAVRNILIALDLTVAIRPAGEESVAPLYGRHADQVAVGVIMKEAAAAAAAVLNRLFPESAPASARVGVAFESRLVEHITAMLSGQGGARNAVCQPLPALIHGYSSLGRPFSLPLEAEGYLVQVDALDLYLDNANDYLGVKKAFVPLRAVQGCFRSWDLAALAVRNAIVAGRAPLGPLTVVPCQRNPVGDLVPITRRPNPLESVSRLLPEAS